MYIKIHQLTLFSYIKSDSKNYQKQTNLPLPSSENLRHLIPHKKFYNQELNKTRRGDCGPNC